MRYSSFLNAINARVEPSGLISSSGQVNLKYEQVTDPGRLLNLGFDTDIKAQKYYTEDIKPNYEKARERYVSYEQKAKENIRLTQQQLDEAGYGVQQTEQTAAQTADAAKTQITTASRGAQNELLSQKLAYERQQSISLLKRFYEKEIDAYIMSVDKSLKQKGQVLMANDRRWIAAKIGTPIYKITCKVNGKAGATQSEMKDYPIGCGVYEVDLENQAVRPLDTTARSIASGEYKN
jgi:hypothetical protein